MGEILKLVWKLLSFWGRKTYGMIWMMIKIWLGKQLWKWGVRLGLMGFLVSLSLVFYYLFR